MPPRAKIKKTMSGSPEDIKMLNAMFDQMTGTSKADPEVIYPKYKKLMVAIVKFHKVFTVFVSVDLCEKFPECSEGLGEIKNFVASIQELINDKEIPEDKINDIYGTLRESKEIKQIITTCGTLGKHRKYLERDNLGDEFIKREPGLSMMPFSFSSLNLKLMWASEQFDPMTKSLVLNILSHTYKIGYEIYDVVTSPNIDIKKFSNVLINNIGNIKKQLPRCDRAFDIIAKSVQMLESNFKDYYKSSIEAENPSLIIESFIVDVSKEQKANPEVTRQFRKIIMHMKKRSEGNNDPRVKKLFTILNMQFSMMEKETPNYEPEQQPQPESEQPEQPEQQPQPESEQPEPEQQPQPESEQPEQPEQQPQPEQPSVQLNFGKP